MCGLLGLIYSLDRRLSQALSPLRKGMQRRLVEPPRRDLKRG